MAVTVAISVCNNIPIHTCNINGMAIVSIPDNITGFQIVQCGRRSVNIPAAPGIPGIEAGGVIAQFFSIAHTLPGQLSVTRLKPVAGLPARADGAMAGAGHGRITVLIVYFIGSAGIVGMIPVLAVGKFLS